MFPLEKMYFNNSSLILIKLRVKYSKARVSPNRDLEKSGQPLTISIVSDHSNGAARVNDLHSRLLHILGHQLAIALVSPNRGTGQRGRCRRHALVQRGEPLVGQPDGYVDGLRWRC